MLGRVRPLGQVDAEDERASAFGGVPVPPAAGTVAGRRPRMTSGVSSTGASSSTEASSTRSAAAAAARCPLEPVTS